MSGYLKRAAGCLLLMLVVAAMAAPADAGRKKPWEKFDYPELGEITLPDYQRVELDNGMTLFLAKDDELPLVELSATIQAGKIYEPAELTGLASVTGEVLRTGGTEKWSGDEIDAMVEAMGAAVETWVGNATGGAYLSALTEDADKALEILAEILMHPRFDQDKIDLAMSQHKAGISRRNDEPMQIAFREFRRMIFGADHPMGTIEEYATLAGITRQHLVDFHERYFHPERVYLVVIGDFEPDAMVAKIEEAFAGWGPATTDLPPDPAMPSFPRTVNVAGKDDLTQSTVVLGHAGIRKDDPNYAAIEVANSILGGGFASRLFVEVRSNRGLAYATGSQSGTGWRFPGVFTAFVGTKLETTEQAIDVILEQIRLMVTEPVTEAELKQAVDGLLNSDVFNYDTKREILDRLVLFDMYGYPADFLDRFRRDVQEMTAARVLEACQAVWRPDDLSILVVGNPEGFDGDLSKYGTVNTIDIAIPQPDIAMDLPPATPESLARGQELLDRAAKAVGGDALAGLKSWRSELGLDLEIQGMALHFGVTQAVAYPDRMRLDQKTPFGEMAQAMDGDAAWAKGPMGVQDITGEDLKKMKEEMAGDMISVLRDHAALHCQALPQSEMGGKLCDPVHVTGAGSDYILFYFDAATGLPVVKQGPGEDPVTKSPVTQKVMYDDFADFGGFKMARSQVILHDDKEFATGVLEDFTPNPDLPASLFAKE